MVHDAGFVQLSVTQPPHPLGWDGCPYHSVLYRLSTQKARYEDPKNAVFRLSRSYLYYPCVLCVSPARGKTYIWCLTFVAHRYHRNDASPQCWRCLLLYSKHVNPV